MSIFLLSIILVGLCVFLLSFNIIFRKNGKFPEKEVGHNREMRKLGLTCAKSDERVMWSHGGKKKRVISYNPTDEDVSCSDCSECSTCGSSKI